MNRRGQNRRRNDVKIYFACCLVCFLPSVSAAQQSSPAQDERLARQVFQVLERECRSGDRKSCELAAQAESMPPEFLDLSEDCANGDRRACQSAATIRKTLLEYMNQRSGGGPTQRPPQRGRPQPDDDDYDLPKDRGRTPPSGRGEERGGPGGYGRQPSQRASSILPGAWWGQILVPNLFIFRADGTGQRQSYPSGKLEFAQTNPFAWSVKQNNEVVLQFTAGYQEIFTITKHDPNVGIEIQGTRGRHILYNCNSGNIPPKLAQAVCR